MASVVISKEIPHYQILWLVTAMEGGIIASLVLINYTYYKEDKNDIDKPGSSITK
jgi:hypothetical protein